MNSEIVDKLYLNPISEINLHRRKLNPIRQKEVSKTLGEKRTLNTCKSVPDLFRGLNGTVIIQNWNTKKDIPRDIGGEYLNLPSLIDRKKLIHIQKLETRNLLDKPQDQLTLLEKIKLSKEQTTGQGGGLGEESYKDLIYNPKDDGVSSSMINLNKMKISNRPIVSRQLRRSSSTITDREKEKEREKIMEGGEESKKDSLVPYDQVAQDATQQALAQLTSKQKVRRFKGLKIIQKKPEVIDFSTFKQHLFLRDNDFLYAKRVGGPVDFALCSYQEINTRLKLDFSKIANIHRQNNNNVVNKNIEYLTISKNTILHYQKGLPHLYSIGEWTDNYIKYKKLLNIPLFKNFKNAGLFGLWKRYYRKKKRLYYTEKLNKRSFYVDINLLNGILEIRRILKEMTLYDLFKLNIVAPVFLNRFNQIFLEGIKVNNKKTDQYRGRVKKELQYACTQSYKEFKLAKNITLDDPYDEEELNTSKYPAKKEEKEGGMNTLKDIIDKNKTKNKLAMIEKQKEREKSNLKSFLKDAIPYAQDATRKKHFKQLLRFIRLIDFLFNDAKFGLIIFSLELLDKKFNRLYESYINGWVDSPLIVTTVVSLKDKISYNPGYELITTAIFDHFVQENIYAVIYKKNYIDPQEFPQYMVCFEEVFDVSVDQNSILNNRIKEDKNFNDLYNSIKLSFDKCKQALDKKALELTPSLVNYNKYMKINFSKVEEEADHKQLIQYINDFKAEDERVRKLSKKINIGIFEFQLESFLEDIVEVPMKLLQRIYGIIPKIMVRKVGESHDKITSNYNQINISVAAGDVKTFIQLKKSVDKCLSKRSEIDQEMDEISELYAIINGNKEIKLEDYDKRKYDQLNNLRTDYERSLDSMVYFIEQNIKQYRAELMVKIKKSDEMLNRIHDELNEDLINNFNEDTLGPLIFLEDKALSINKAVENKKVFQEQEVDIEMDPADRSNFENLDFVTYEYELKKNLWKNLNQYQELSVKWEKMQILEIKTPVMEERIKVWKNLCIVSLKDLDNSNVSKEFLDQVNIYEKVLHILKIIQNENIQKVDYLKDLLKVAMNINNIEFNDNNFILEKILNMPGVYDAIPVMDEINKRANEEKKIKTIYKETLEKFSTHHIPLKLKIEDKFVSKYIIKFEDFDKEQEFIESLLSILNKEMLNPYITVLEKDFTVLINNIYKYQTFLEVFYDYQIYMLKTDNLLINTEFSKEFPSEYKKLCSESITKYLVKTLKEALSLGKYVDYAHDRIITNLRTLISNYETNYKSIHQYLMRRRKECQEYYLLNDDELIALIELKDSFDIREKLLLKIYPYIKTLNPGKDNDDNLIMTTKYDNEKIICKYVKGTRTFKDGVECIELGISKKLKEFYKSFKRAFDTALKPKSLKMPKDIILDYFDSNDIIYQVIFIGFYHTCYYFLEKTLEKESEAFDKLFDYYHEIKDEWKKKYIIMLKEIKEPRPNKVKFIITIISIIDYFINSIEILLRDDVSKVTDYSYTKVPLIKIENDNVAIKIFSYNFDYGSEYTGLHNDFFVAPQTEKTFLAILNAFYIHKSFLLCNNQNYFKNETLAIVSTVLGRRIFNFTANDQFSIEGLNNILYGNMCSGQLVYINNVELIQSELINVLVDRINEIYRLLHTKQEEGYFIDIDSEKYSINMKKFNVFFSYCLDCIHINNSEMNIPYKLKNNFRIIGINYIDFSFYLKYLMKSYAINKAEYVSDKLIFILKTISCKCNLINKNNMKETLEPLLIERMKEILIHRRHEINKKTVYDIFKETLKEIIYPFIKGDTPEKESFDTLLNVILFDYDEKEKKEKNLKSKGGDNKKSKAEKNEKNHINSANINNNNNMAPPSEMKDEAEPIYTETLARFSFGNNLYKDKIKGLYEALNDFQSIIILGPTMSGKSNALVSIRDISLKLNKLNNEKYPIFNYVKIFPNSMDYLDIFIRNKKKFNHQINNIYFRNIVGFLNNPMMIDEITKQYKKMSTAQGEILVFAKEEEKKEEPKDNNKDNINNNNKDFQAQKEEEPSKPNPEELKEKEKKEEGNEPQNKEEGIEKKNEGEEGEKKEEGNEGEKKEGEEGNEGEEKMADNTEKQKDDNNNKEPTERKEGEEEKKIDEEDKEKDKEKNDNNNNEAEKINEDEVNKTQTYTQTKENKEDKDKEGGQQKNEFILDKKEEIIITNEYKTIIFDGSISPLWYTYLTNLIDQNSLFTLQDFDYVNLSTKKFIYETSTLSNVSPSFITKQNIISFDRESFNWLNIAYAFVENNFKISKNEELKNYIKGLFENYGENIIDFVEVNRLKCCSYCINSSYIIKNLINLFDSILPEYDFTDIKIGRRNLDYVPKIDIIKRQTLCIFIFCSAWVMNLLTNFLIRNKIEKTVSDMFKSDDLKGPIFDYFLEEDKYTFCLWSTILQEAKYAAPKTSKNEVFYYNKFFVNTIENIPYYYIINKMLLNEIPLLVIGKPCSGKTFILNNCLNELETSLNEAKSIKIIITHKTQTADIENDINKNLNLISRRVYGDRYLRKTIVFIDDMNINQRTSQLNEYIRYLLNTKSTYDQKNNVMKYYKDFNLIATGNFYNTVLSKKNNSTPFYDYNEYNDNKVDYSRYTNKFSLVSLNFQQNYFSSLYKPTFESHMRNYIPNTSNITANQYLAVLFKLNQLLVEQISPSYSNLHYCFSMRDISQIIQRFNMFMFRGSNEYPEYIKKLFLYEAYLLYTDKINKKTDIDIFKDNLIQAYNTFFKQDKLDLSIFSNIDKDDNYIYARNFIDVYEENKPKNEGENVKYIYPQDLEYVFIQQKKDLKEFLINKIKSYYSDYYHNGGAKGTEDTYFILHDYNHIMIDYLIRILSILNNQYPNMILIGKDYSGKDLLARIGLFIMRYDYTQANLGKLISKGREAFEEEMIIKPLQEVVFCNRKIFLIFQHELFNNINDEDKLYILEIISALFDPEVALDKFGRFMNTNEFGDVKISKVQILKRLKQNLNIILSINSDCWLYQKLFIDYPLITNNSSILYLKEFDDDNLCTMSNYIFDRFECLMSNNLTKLLIDIYNYVKILYDDYKNKININISINQRHFMNMCEFISTNYKKYKDILLKNKENYEKINLKLKGCSIGIQEKENLIKSINPQKENSEKLIEDCRKLISEKNVEKGKIKQKKLEEEGPMNISKDIRAKKISQLDDALRHTKDLIGKTKKNLNKLNDKDLLDCKNAWDNFNFGKLLLSKIFEAIGDGNCDDWDYVKKSIAPKHFSKLTNIDYTKPKPQYKEIVKQIVSNAEFGGNDKFNKPYKLAGVICDYFNRINKFFKIYDENHELVEEIEALDKKIEEHKNLINKYLEQFKIIDDEILDIERRTENYELNKTNAQNQIDKIKSLNKQYTSFIQLVSEKEEIFKKKSVFNSSLLKYFDYYIIYIACYINFAPILSYHYRQKIKNFLIQNINLSLENVAGFDGKDGEENKEEEGGVAKKEGGEKAEGEKEEGGEKEDEDNKESKRKKVEIKDIDFSELMFNFLDINGKDKELYTSSGIFNEFIKENFIFMHISKNKVPLIIDYTQNAKEIIKEYLEFERMQNFQLLSFNNTSDQSNEFMEKLESTLKNGSNLFIDNITDINKIYSQFYNYINQRFSGEKSKRLVAFDDKKFEVVENFRLFLFKNIYGNKMRPLDNNIWFNMLFINFSLPKDDIRERIFLYISKTRNELAYNGLKKIRNDKIRKSLMKIDSEKKMVDKILQFDLSGNLDKISDAENINERLRTECRIHSNCENLLESMENKFRRQKAGLIINYNNLCKDASVIIKWIYRFTFYEPSYLIDSSSLYKYIIDFIEEKLSLRNEIENFNGRHITEEGGGENNDDDNKSNYFSAKSKPNRQKDDDDDDEDEDDDEEEDNAKSRIAKQGDNDDVIDEQKVSHVIKEIFIYNSTKDSKSLTIFFYNKVKSIFINNDLKQSLLLVCAFVIVNLQSQVPIPFKQCLLNNYLYDRTFNEFFEESEIIESPIKNISNKQWTILKKISDNAGQILEDIFVSIEKEKEKWNNYLEDSITDVTNHYFLNNLEFPDKELEKSINPSIRFIFFNIIKPYKKEFLINIFFKQTIYKVGDNKEEDVFFLEGHNSKEYACHTIKTKIENYDIIQSFKNYNVIKDKALILIAPPDNINIYDKLLYEFCYLKMFTTSSKEKENANAVDPNNVTNNNMSAPSKKMEGGAPPANAPVERILSNKLVDSKGDTNQNNGQQNPQQVAPSSSEIKIKEFVLDNNVDLTQQDCEFIKVNIKIGAMIIIKNAHFLGNHFNDLLNEMSEIKKEDISPSFKLILICNMNEVIKNKRLYEECLVVNDNLLFEEGFAHLSHTITKKKRFISVKENILNLIIKIPNEFYNYIINTQIMFMRPFLRKLIYSYIIIFGLLESIPMQNPFIFSRKDFFSLFKFILTYIETENFSEEKFKNDFINPDAPTGINYITFIHLINNIFIFDRQIEHNDECKVNKLISDIFNYKVFMHPEFYLDLGNVKINIVEEHKDLSFEDVYNSFSQFFSEEYENLLPYQSIIEQKEKQYKYSENVFNNIISIFDYKYNEEDKSNKLRKSFEISKILNALSRLRDLTPPSVQYYHQETTVDLENNENNINPSLFKKNKHGIYFSPLDESLFFEVVLLNKRLENFHEEINILINMLEGNMLYNDYYYDVFEILNRGKIPQEINIFNDFFFLNKSLKIGLYNEIVQSRITMFKTWIKDGNLPYYHLPLFNNLDLFIYCVKMNFCRKFYGENDYSDTTPEMVRLKFITTRFKTYEDLVSPDNKTGMNLDFYNSVYHNDIIWIDGLILNNASIDETNKHLVFGNMNKNTKIKLNLIGITYVVEKKEIETSEGGNNDNEGGEEEEEEEEEEENEDEKKKKEENNEDNNKDTEKNKTHENEEKEEDKNTIKIYIEGNKSQCVFNKYFKEENIGYLEFKTDGSLEQNYVFENDIKITVEDLDDFTTKNKK